MKLLLLVVSACIAFTASATSSFLNYHYHKVIGNHPQAFSSYKPIEEVNWEKEVSNTLSYLPNDSGLTGKTNYYFSTNTGDDSRTSEQAKNPATPWKTISKLNAYFPSLKPGDAVLFKRGEIFAGSITVKKSGIAGEQIIISAYGSGTKPVINGFSNLLNWNSTGNGVWECDFQTSGRVNMVTLNGVVQAMGRYPNFTDPEKGYLTCDTHSGLTSITDNELTGTTNWTGAELVIRKVDWVLDRGQITAHSGTTLSYVSPTGHQPTDGYGYFIQNSPKTLDKYGEWYYDDARKKMLMYFGTLNPNLHDVKGGAKDTLVIINNYSYLIFDNLYFQGADEVAFGVKNASYLMIQNSEFNNTGLDAIYVENTPYLSVVNNTINHSNNSGIRIYPGCHHALIKNNYIKNSGLLPGMGRSNNQQHDGIFAESGPLNIIESNRIDSSGYCGITFTGDSTIIRNNFINTFCLTVNDGGGIYTWGGFDKVARKVMNNIILNGIGAPEGTHDHVAGGAVGIYTDDRSASIEITGNTVAYCSRSGIFLHNSHEIALTSNTVFNNEAQLNIVHDGLEIKDPIRNIFAEKNIFFSKKQYQNVIACGSLSDDFQFFGSFDNNAYARPLDKNGIISLNFVSENGSCRYSFYDLKGWQNKYRFDINSSKSPIDLPPFRVSKLIGNNKFTNGKFDNNIDGAFCLSSPGKCTSSWNGEGKINEGSLKISFDAPGTDLNDVATYINIGPVTAGRNYVIRFSLFSPNTGKTLKGFMIDGNNYSHLSMTQYFELTNNRTDHEFQFNPTISSGNAVLTFEIFGKDLPFYLDNFEAYEAEVLITNPDDYIRFEYNATNSSKTVALNDTYVDVKNKSYQKEVILEPYTSVVLIKQATTTSQMQITDRPAAIDVSDAAASNIRISPNPATNNIQISTSTLHHNKNASLTLYSVLGVEVKTASLILSNQPFVMDVSSLTSGSYFIQLNVNGTIINEKFIKL